MHNRLFDRIQAVCAAQPQKVLFVEGAQVSIIRAARVLQDKGWTLPELIGGPYEIRDMAATLNLPTRGLKITNPRNGHMREALLKDIRSKLGYKDLSRPQLEGLLIDALVQSVLRVKQGAADMAFGGNLSGIQSVVRAYLKHSGTHDGFERASSAYFLFSQTDERVFAFADCSINVEPSAVQLADIARHTARRYTHLTNETARVAFLSFSSKGSAQHEQTEKMAQATEIVKKTCPNLICDGELQFDAAIDPIVAKKKAPKSSLNGKANVFIFPSLNAANIAEKIVSHLAGYRSIGPVFQGFNDALHYIPGHALTGAVIDLVILAAYFKIVEESN